MPGKVVIFVLGAGRTGSSVLTRMLALAGADLPHPLLGANPGNPTGHWEPLEAIRINDTFLSTHHSNWYDPSLRVQDGAEANDRAALHGDIQAFLAQHQSALLVVKDPRIAAVAETWFTAAEAAGFSVAVVLPLRHPSDSVASLMRRDGMSAELAAALWLKYTLLSEHASRSRARVVVEYSRLLADWRGELARIAAALQLVLCVADDSAADLFLDRALCHHAQLAPPQEVLGMDWLGTTYATLSAASRDDMVQTEDLDRIYRQYAACERGFRHVFTDFEQHWSATIQ